jgi:GDP-L-fucose synthase
MANVTGATHLNIGVGDDVSIRELAELIADVVGWTGEFRYRADRPDGTPRKLLDVSKLHALGWKERIGLREGIETTYQWFLEHQHDARGTH